MIIVKEVCLAFSFVGGILLGLATAVATSVLLVNYLTLWDVL